MDTYSTLYTPQYSSHRKKRGHTGCFVTIAVIAAVLLAMVFTCPAPTKHKEMIATVVSTAVSNVATEEYGILGAMGSMLAAGAVSTTVSDLVTVKDYIVCSVGTMPYQGDNIIVSVGLFNHVFTVHSDVIEKKLRDIIDSLPLHE